MINTRRRPTNGTSEQGLNDLTAQLEMLTGHLYLHTQRLSDVAERLPPRRKHEQVVDYFRGSASPASPAGTATSISYPLDWIPAPALISSVIVSVGGTADATLIIGKRVYFVNVGAGLPMPLALALSPEGALIVYPNDAITLSVPSTPVMLSLEMMGRLWNLDDTHQVYQ